MFIEKWYADIVDDDAVQIIYRANLHLGPLTMGYRSRLSQGRLSTTNVGIYGTTMPEVIDTVVRWPTEVNEPAIAWRGVASRPKELWRSGNDVITWDPLVLNGGVSVAGCCRSARGYVERLTMNFKPWDLGLKKLKWGRFCGSKHSLVWIEWEGRIPNKLALLDGVAEPLLEASRMSIRTQQVHLAMYEPKEIVSEPIGTGALKALGLLRLFAARQFLSGIETKWIAKGVLSCPGVEEDQGVVVYEEVLWA